MRDLDLALIGNGAIGLLIDASGSIVWGCFPRFDSDATFCALLDEASPGAERGIWSIDLVDLARTEQAYITNTAVLTTRLFDKAGNGVEITDCVPRFVQFGRIFHPVSLVRQIRKVSGSPRVVVPLRPAVNFGSERPASTVGSGHIRYVTPEMTLRLTTDASLTAILEERPFFVNDDVTLVLGPDETVATAVGELGRRFIEETVAYWRDWVRRLAIPFEWQGAVIRAAITLQLNAYSDTGAIVAAMTSSIPESAQSSRNWDYRCCWLHDGCFVVDALNRLNATETMERYLAYIVNIAAGVDKASLQPVYRIMGDPIYVPREAGAKELERYGKLVEAALNDVTAERRLWRAPLTPPALSVVDTSGWMMLRRVCGDSAIAHSRRSTSPMPGCGSSAAIRASTRSRPSCAGQRATASRASLRGSASRTAPRNGAPTPLGSPASSTSAALTPAGTALSAPRAGAGSMRASCSSSSWVSWPATILGSSPRSTPSPPSSSAAISSFATSSATILSSPRTRFSSARSGT
jgi:hypothetical protein